MPTLPTINPTLDPRLQAYYDDLDDLTGQALRGEIDEQQFKDEANQRTRAALLLAFLLAGGDVGTEAARRVIAAEMARVRQSVETLADDIYSERYSGRDEASEGRPAQTAVEGREKLRNRLALWVFTVAGIYHAGQQHTPPRLVGGQLVEPRYVWRLGNTEQHCKDCASLDGTVLTASEWQRAGIRPQDPSLECGGWRCDCSLIQTDEASVGLEGVTV